MKVQTTMVPLSGKMCTLIDHRMINYVTTPVHVYQLVIRVQLVLILELNCNFIATTLVYY